ncbi:TolC family protein [Prolixibacteraceae bacterium JC049]|nr:TolC family protein [Prolixibacteraceae bacterium JC049]
MSKLGFWLGLLLSILFVPLMAQEQVQSFTLAEAKAYAMENSYELRKASIDVTKAKKEVWATIARGLPHVEGKAGYNKNLNLPVSLLPGELAGQEKGTYIPVKFGQDFNSNFGFSVSQLLFDGSYIVGLESADLYVRLAIDAEEKSEIEIRDLVAQSYYTVLIAKASLKVMEDNLKNAQDMLSQTRAYYENGLREEQDVDQLLLLEKKAENEVSKAKREVKVAKTVLKYVMGLPVSSSIELTDNLNQLVNIVLVSADEKVKFDATQHIDYRLQEGQVASKKKLLKLEYTAYLPTLEAYYNWDKTAQTNTANVLKDHVPWFSSSSVGVSLKIKLFSSAQRISKIRQAKLSLEQEQIKKEQTFQNLQKDYLTAITELESVIEKYENDKENEALAKKIHHKTQVKFNNGLANSIELSQSESQFIQAHGTYVASCLELLRTRVKLDKILSKL